MKDNTAQFDIYYLQYGQALCKVIFLNLESDSTFSSSDHKIHTLIRNK